MLNKSSRNAAWTQGVLPGEYQVIWRTMKVATGNVGSGISQLTMSVLTSNVHRSSTNGTEISDTLTCPLQHFNNLTPLQWVDVPGGKVCISEFSNITVKMWCHSGEWKHGLAWDSVRLVDVNKPVVVEPQVQTPITSSTAAGTLVQGIQAAGEWCRIT